MMRNLVLILAAIAFMAVSCKKDDSSTPDNLKGLVKKFVYDDGEVYSFEYDEQKRLIKETDTDDEDVIIIVYEYDQNGKIAKASYSENGATYSIDKFEWVGNKVTKTDNEGTDLEQKQVYEFDESGKLIKYEQYVDHGSGNELSYYEEYVWENGNITKGKQFNASGVETGTMTYEYDSRPNNSPYASVGFFPGYLSANIITKNTRNTSSYSSETKYSYTYSDGSTYPESVVETDFYNGTQISTYSYDCEYY